MNNKLRRNCGAAMRSLSDTICVTLFLCICQNNNVADFPSELDIFYVKHMLFKVEVADGNLIHNWRSYAVKRITDDGDMIKRFMVLHNIKLLCSYNIHIVINLLYEDCL
jgi:hypothetical protein